MANLKTSDVIAAQERMMLEMQRRRFMMEREEEMVRPGMMVQWDRNLFLWGQEVDLRNAPNSEPDRKAIPRFGVALADESESDHQLAKEAELLLGYSVLRRKLKIAGKLGEVLALLDIEPLNFEAVEKYKAEMVLWRHKEFAQKIAHDALGRPSEVLDVSWNRLALADCKNEVPTFALRKAIQVKKACPEAILEVDELHEQKRLIDPFLVARLDDETYYLEVWKEPKFEETL